nr:ATP-binding cassette domain-containing protein [Candidatus Sigynarchaeum springense]MDO8117402.1 ATP-binding cassette domain-containing protein [Candidatus Sigynarchaeota archaeon]
MLDISGLTINVQEGSAKRVIIKDLSLHVDEGEIHVIFGPNGSGKTTLLHAILGYPGINIEAGKIVLDGIDITALPVHERVRRGIGMIFQNPPSIRGITLNDISVFIAGKNGHHDQGNFIMDLAKKMKLEGFLGREINYGFSGGEKKRAELFQALLQDPDLLLLDELDSGVDVENLDLLCSILHSFFHSENNGHARKKSGLLITHSGYILKKIKTYKAHVLINGEITCSGPTEEIYNGIVENGFVNCMSSSKCPKKNQCAFFSR